MKFILSLIFCLMFTVSQAQTEPKQMPNLDDIDLNIDLDEIFGMLDSLPMELGQFGNLNELFSENFGDLSENKEMFNDLMQQSMKMIEKLDMNEVEGLMDNFMKEFENLDLDEMIDTEEMERIIEKHAKKRKI